MNPAHKRMLVSGSRFVIVLAVLLSPLPYVADAYVCFFSSVANPLLSVCAPERFDLHLESPGRIAREGSWKPLLRVSDLISGAEGAVHIDVRTLSYRSMAAFVALALAWPPPSRKRTLRMFAVGAPATLLATLAFGALPILNRFARTGYFGSAGSAVETAYQALSTPMMVYLMPLGVWAVLRFRWPPRNTKDVAGANRAGGRASTVTDLSGSAA
jgi:hypothetical protein